MLIAVCSLKGSPGVTTASVALAARWPQPAPVVVECDPSGGSLVARCRLPLSPGLVTLAAAACRDTATRPRLWSHVQRLPAGVSAVVAPPGADHTRAALNTLLHSRTQTSSVLRTAATPPGTVVIADCGRLDRDSPAVRIAREADRVLLLAHPRTDELAHLAAAMEMVDLWSMRPALLLVGPGHSDTEITHHIGIRVTARLPMDPRGAQSLYSDRTTRSRLTQTAHHLARLLTSPPRGHPSPTRPTPIERSGHIP